MMMIDVIADLDNVKNGVSIGAGLMKRKGEIRTDAAAAVNTRLWPVLGGAYVVIA